MNERKKLRSQWRAGLVFVSLWVTSCADPATAVRTDGGEFTDAAPAFSPPDSGPLDAPPPPLPPPGPLPIFTPATPVPPKVPDEIVRINTTIDCDQQVAAQIADGDHFATLQGALTSAASGDTVQVCPGQHKGGFLLTRGITLESFSRDADDTILDGEKKQLVLTVAIEKGMAPLRLHNLTLRNGQGHQPPSITGDITGGALLVSSAAPVEIAGCVFEKNGSRGGGGAIILLRSPATTIAKTVFRANESGYGGGALSIVFKGAERLVIIDSLFENNNAGYSGGALDVSHYDVNPGPPSITITRTSFLANTSGYEGGAISVGGGALAYGGKDSQLPMTIEDCRFVGNRAKHSGGAIQTGSSVQTPLVIRNTLADNNFAGVSGSAYAIEENFSSWGEKVAILISGGQITRNGADGGAAAIDLTAPAVMKLIDVDLGEGASENPGGDVRLCPGRYGAHTSLTYPLCI